MRPIHFDEANTFLGPPKGQTEEQCMTISAYKGIDSNGDPYWFTLWQPNYEDMEALKAGRGICIKTMGEHFQPVCPYTVDEKGEYNG